MSRRHGPPRLKSAIDAAAGGGSTGRMDPAEEKRHVAALVERLTEMFPELAPTTVEETVTSVHRDLGDAPVRDYVPLLVEREAIDTLKARARDANTVER